jgi:uncharacterized protein (DUF305 family)
MRAETLKKVLAAVVLVAVVAVPVAGLALSAAGPSAVSGRGPMGGGPMGGGLMGGGPMGGGPRMMAGMDGMAVASEFDYLAQMIPHHEEAIAAAEVLRDGTERPEMRTFAEQIIETQSAEVAQMRQWLAAWYPELDPAVEYSPMMRDLDGLSGDELDRAFLQDMIPHHMMAVMMSRQLVAQELAEHGEVVPFAGTIETTQHAEIFQMASWLRSWFGESAMPGMMLRP